MASLGSAGQVRAHKWREREGLEGFGDTRNAFGRSHSEPVSERPVHQTIGERRKYSSSTHLCSRNNAARDDMHKISTLLAKTETGLGIVCVLEGCQRIAHGTTSYNCPRVRPGRPKKIRVIRLRAPGKMQTGSVPQRIAAGTHAHSLCRDLRLLTRRWDRELRLSRGG